MLILPSTIRMLEGCLDWPQLLLPRRRRTVQAGILENGQRSETPLLAVTRILDPVARDDRRRLKPLHRAILNQNQKRAKTPHHPGPKQPGTSLAGLHATWTFRLITAVQGYVRPTQWVMHIRAH